MRSETPPKNITGYKISNSLWTELGILSPVTFLEAWLGVSERTPYVSSSLYLASFGDIFLVKKIGREVGGYKRV